MRPGQQRSRRNALQVGRTPVWVVPMHRFAPREMAQHVTADLLRALSIAVIAIALAALLRPAMRSRGMVLLLGAWVAMPAIAVAWPWALLAGSGTWRDHLLHACLSGLRLAPVALLARALAPAPAVDAVGLHLLRLSGWSRPRRAWTWLVHGPGRAWLPAVGLTAVLGFAEFELASRLAVSTWAVRIFDAQAGGMPIADTAVAAVPGALMQMVILVIAGWNLRGATTRSTVDGRRSTVRQLAAAVVLILGTLVLLVVPAWVIVRGGLRGVQALADVQVWREVAAGVTFAVAGGTAAWLLPGWLRAVLLPVACAGSLALGLGLLLLTTGTPLADSPVPLILALMLVALPAVWLLRRIISVDTPSHHAARLLASVPGRRTAATRIAWQAGSWQTTAALLAVLLVAAGDLAATAMLHPLAAPPALVRCYQFMHYGHSDALAARLMAWLVAGAAGTAGLWLMARALPLRTVRHG